MTIYNKYDKLLIFIEFCLETITTTSAATEKKIG